MKTEDRKKRPCTQYIYYGKRVQNCPESRRVERETQGKNAVAGGEGGLCGGLTLVWGTLVVLVFF
jgi:hypothetical protein